MELVQGVLKGTRNWIIWVKEEPPSFGFAETSQTTVRWQLNKFRKLKETKLTIEVGFKR